MATVSQPAPKELFSLAMELTELFHSRNFQSMKLSELTKAYRKYFRPKLTLKRLPASVNLVKFVEETLPIFNYECMTEELLLNKRKLFEYFFIPVLESSKGSVKLFALKHVFKKITGIKIDVLTNLFCIESALGSPSLQSLITVVCHESPRFQLVTDPSTHSIFMQLISSDISGHKIPLPIHEAFGTNSRQIISDESNMGSRPMVPESFQTDSRQMVPEPFKMDSRQMLANRPRSGDTSDSLQKLPNPLVARHKTLLALPEPFKTDSRQMVPDPFKMDSRQHLANRPMSVITSDPFLKFPNPHIELDREIPLPPHISYQPGLNAPPMNSRNFPFPNRKPIKAETIEDVLKDVNSKLQDAIEELSAKGKFVPVDFIRDLLFQILRTRPTSRKIDWRQVKVMEDYSKLHGRVNELIKVFCLFNPLTSLYELEYALINSEKLNSFEDLHMGPLLKHPSVRRFFSPPDDLEEVPRISEFKLRKHLMTFLSKRRRGDTKSTLEEFLDFVKKNEFKESTYHLCVRVTSYSLAVQVTNSY